MNDIPGMLRRTAERIEAGEFGKIDAALVLIPRHGDYPTVFGFGDVERENDPAIQCELAKMWLLSNMVQRG